ncbi:hypothetical protein ON010_g1606 [Phytophthora cinnamomi]|nr:hypothetical protein ON010_g1606 [Phytophthora cinnamomi]
MGSGEVCTGQGAGQIVRQEDPGQRELAQAHCGRLSLPQEGVAGVYGGPGLLPRRDGAVRRAGACAHIWADADDPRPPLRGSPPWCSNAWNALDADTIKSCWRHAGLYVDRTQIIDIIN